MAFLQSILKLQGPLDPIFLALFNASFCLCYVPKLFKTSVVTPIPKIVVASTNSSKYRPISQVPMGVKLIESIINCRIMDKLKNESLLCNFKMRFRKKRSTVLAFKPLIDDLYKAKKRQEGSILLNLDFTKAYNLVWLDALFHKMLNLRFSNSIVKWMEALTRQRFLRF